MYKSKKARTPSGRPIVIEPRVSHILRFVLGLAAWLAHALAQDEPSLALDVPTAASGRALDDALAQPRLNWPLGLLPPAQLFAWAASPFKGTCVCGRCDRFAGCVVGCGWSEATEYGPPRSLSSFVVVLWCDTGRVLRPCIANTRALT